MSLSRELEGFARSLAGGAPGEEALGELGLSPSAARTYRKLVRRNFVSALQRMAPRFLAELGPALGPVLDDFLAAEFPRSRYLRDVPLEVVRFCRGRAATPPWATDLGEWELSSFRAMAAPDEAEAEPGDLALDRSVRFSRSVVLLRLSFAVVGWRSGAAPHRRPEDVLVHRTRAGEVAEAILTPVVAQVVEQLLEGVSLGEAVAGAASASGRPLDARLVEEVAGALEGLRSAGALLGAGAASASGSVDPEGAKPDLS